MTCNACNQTIYDRHMFKTSPDNKFWHSECLKCCECNKPLDSRYFETSGRLYCRNDYLTFYGPSCFGCAGKITDEQYFFSVKQQASAIGPSATVATGSTNTAATGGPQSQNQTSLFFHDKCFACGYCNRPLQKGDKYCILDNSPNLQAKTLLICHEICALKYHSTSVNNNSSSNNNNNNGNSANNANTTNNSGMPPINSTMLPTGTGQPLQANAAPAPRAKRGRMKQSRG